MTVLVGQYDSPFVRRAAAALHHHAIPFERRPLSVFADFEAVRAINPLGKVPALILDGGETLFDSRAIVEHAEEVGGGAPLRPADPAARREMLRLEAVGIGLAEKGYERGIEVSRRAPGAQDPAWMARLETQIASALDWLEARAHGEFLVGGSMSRADLAVAIALTYLAEKLPSLCPPGRRPRLERHREAMEASPPFAAAPFARQEALATGWRPETEARP